MAEVSGLIAVDNCDSSSFLVRSVVRVCGAPGAVGAVTTTPELVHVQVAADPSPPPPQQHHRVGAVTPPRTRVRRLGAPRVAHRVGPWRVVATRCAAAAMAYTLHGHRSAARVCHRQARHRPSRSGTCVASRTCHTSRIGARATAAGLGAASEPSDLAPSAPGGVGRLTARPSPCRPAGPPGVRAARSTTRAAHGHDVGGVCCLARRVVARSPTGSYEGFRAKGFLHGNPRRRRGDQAMPTRFFRESSSHTRRLARRSSSSISSRASGSCRIRTGATRSALSMCRSASLSRAPSACA
jgi:hypothetical protein